SHPSSTSRSAGSRGAGIGVTERRSPVTARRSTQPSSTSASSLGDSTPRLRGSPRQGSRREFFLRARAPQLRARPCSLATSPSALRRRPPSLTKYGSPPWARYLPGGPSSPKQGTLISETGDL